MAEAERLRAQAERCKRFAFFITDQATVRSLSDLAEESLSEAAALEAARSQGAVE